MRAFKVCGPRCGIGVPFSAVARATLTPIKTPRTDLLERHFNDRALLTSGHRQRYTRSTLDSHGRLNGDDETGDYSRLEEGRT